MGKGSWGEGVKVYISPQVDETKLTFKNLPKKVIIIKNAIGDYNTLINLTQEQKARMEVIHINEKNLQGHLDLSDFTNLKRLDCSNNNLTTITLAPNLTNLKELDLRNNNFPNQDLNKYSLCLKCLQPNTSSN